MNKPETGGVAFPACNESNVNGTMGMTLRDYIAVGAMQGDLASQSDETGHFYNNTATSDLIDRARFYYRFADAMILVKGE